jgi:hypothetical protein
VKHQEKPHDKSHKAEKSDKAEKAEKHTKAEKPEKTERPEKAERLERRPAELSKATLPAEGLGKRKPR